jgi:hypothetical protein
LVGNALDVQDRGGKPLNVPDSISRSPASPVNPWRRSSIKALG